MVLTQAASTPMMDRPWLSTPMIRAPTMAPGMVPMPPVTAVPPMKQAAMASISNSMPVCAEAEARRDRVMIEAMETRKPMFRKISKSTFLVSMPERMAALRLPPTAYTLRPKTMRLRTK